MKNLLTDIAGVRVGHADDASACVRRHRGDVRCARRWRRSMCAAAGPAPAKARCSTSPTPWSGSTPSRLRGGSAFGLEAGGGVQAWLAEHGRGFAVRGAIIPIVPGAIMFDLLNGGDKAWGRFPPYRDLGYTAAAAASDEFCARQRRRRARRHHSEFQGRDRLGIGGDTRRRPGRGTRGGQCGRHRHGRRRAVVLGGAVRDRRRIWRARIAALVHAGHAGDASQGRRCRDRRREYHARGGRNRCGVDTSRRPSGSP